MKVVELYESRPLNQHTASMYAERFTEAYKEYYTAIPSGDGEWIVTNRFDPRVNK